MPFLLWLQERQLATATLSYFYFLLWVRFKRGKLKLCSPNFHLEA
jgi:hypothetical protein